MGSLITSIWSVLLIFILSSRSYVAAPVSIAPTDGLLPNGDFREEPNPSNLKNKVNIVGKYSLPKWVKKGLVRYISSGPQPGGWNIRVPGSGHAVRIGKQGSISQFLQVKKGSCYALTFSATKRCTPDPGIQVIVNVNSAHFLLKTFYSGDHADTFSWAFQPTSNIVEVTFYSPPGLQKNPTCGPLLEAVAIKELPPLPKPKGNLVKNGDLENGPHVLENFTRGVYLPPHSLGGVSPLPGWIIESPNDAVDTIKYIHSKHFFVPTTSYAVELVGGNESSISQLVTTIPSHSYILSFAVGDANNGCIQSMLLQVFVGNEAFKVAYESQGKGGVTHAIFNFQAVFYKTKITFRSAFFHVSHHDLTLSCGPVLDDVRVIPAP